nr:hypothetical protein [Alkalilimnicola ehrlichii]
MQPPVASRRPTSLDAHDETRVDEYFWLRNRDDPEVLAYLEAENAYTEAQMAHTAPLQETLYREFLSRIKETDLSVPVKRDEWFYYSRTEQGRQYPLFCRKHGSVDAAEEIVLDINLLAEGHDYFDIGSATVSPDHSMLVYGEDTDGSERYRLRVKALASGELLDVDITNTAANVEWCNDNRTFYYTVLDETRRPYRVYRHRLGQGVPDELVFEEPDEAFFVHLGHSKDRRQLYISLGSNVTSEEYFLAADDPEAQPVLFQAREHGVEYSIEHRAGEFWVLSNRDAVDFRLFRVPVQHYQETSAWQEYVPHREKPSSKTSSYFGIFSRFICATKGC